MKKRQAKSPPSIIHLEKVEMLELENIGLKIGNANEEVAALYRQQEAVQQSIFAKAGISWEDAQGWLINVKNGTIAKPKIAQTPEQKTRLIESARKELAS